MPTLNQIRAAIAAKIGTVANSGVVHEYERYAKSPSDLATKYFYGSGANKRLHGWFIRRVNTKEIFVDTGRWAIYHGWRIRGFMGLEDADATEKLFDTEIEAIRDAFRLDPSLGDLVFECIAQNGDSGIQVLSSGPVLFANVLCHSAELGLTTQHLQ